MSHSRTAQPQMTISADVVSMVVYTVAIFSSAFLLFSIQPLFARLVLPKLGGSPMVWSVAMVFFQATLLCGYAYAHWLCSALTARKSALVHLGVLLAATFFLPISISAAWDVPPAEGQSLWLIGLFAASVGAPFMALSANAPLLQSWFSKSGHAQAANPYTLYAASNIGSFLSLFAYPFLFEPSMTLSDQKLLWTLGYYVLIAMVAGCALLVWRQDQNFPVVAETTEPVAVAPRAAEIVVWIALAFVPSALLVAVSAHITTDVAAAPFLWILPLALFLLTFVLVFSAKPLLSPALMLRLQPLAIFAVAALIVSPHMFSSLFAVVAIHLVTFFICAMVCHGALAARRPDARHLSAFYLWMSFGGVLGGIFSGLLAPKLFSKVAEYPLLVVLALLCRPGFSLRQALTDTRLHLGIALALAIMAIGYALKLPASHALPGFAIAGFGICCIIALSQDKVPARLAAALAVGFGIMSVFSTTAHELSVVRSFFGVHRVELSDNGEYRFLKHGTTIHGVERLADAPGRPEPLSYYHRGSPLGGTVLAMQKLRPEGAKIGVVGLGSGSLACHIRDNDQLSYYEIDDAVIDIAKKQFRFLGACAPNARIVLGDARLTLAQADQPAFDVLIVDAFSSDSIPVHLMTTEAIEIYTKRLAPGGVLLFHISNRHMELASIVTAIAKARGLDARIGINKTIKADFDAGRFSAIVAFVGAPANLDAVANLIDVPLTRSEIVSRPWSDDYADVIGSIRRHYLAD